jgi:hypothetical protein
MFILAFTIKQTKKSFALMWQSKVFVFFFVFRQTVRKSQKKNTSILAGILTGRNFDIDSSLKYTNSHPALFV